MTNAEKAHKNKLVQLGCMACRRLFPCLASAIPELHHLRTGGWGKGDYMTLIPLCYRHHRGADGIHTLGTKAWDKHYSEMQGFTQRDLLDDALRLTRVNP